MSIGGPILLFRLFLCLIVAGLAGCGGGGGGGGGAVSTPGNDSAADNPPEAGPAPAPDQSQPALAMPVNIASGSTVELQCGRYYQGTLDLRGKSNVTVRVSGTCGKAIVTPAQQVTGWTRHQGSIYSAPLSFTPVQVIVGGQPMSQAHWPNKPQTWAKAESSTADTLRYPMPNGDLQGATLIFKPYEWAIEARRIISYSNGTMSLTSTGNPNYDGYGLGGQVDFYVEGKLWMLDEPGEWAYQDGRLYLWSPDGQSPEGGVWASPSAHGIDASDSRDVTIDGIGIFGAVNGISAVNAVNLRVLNADITNSSGNGIVNSGGRGLTVDGSIIRNSRHDGIIVKWGGGGDSVRNSRVEAAGTLGMPVNTHGAIVLTVAEGSTVENNVVTSSGYLAIRVFRNGTVHGNIVNGACLVLSDCGAIYTSARDRLPLNVRIDGNTVHNVGQAFRLAWAIYLDDSANAVSVTNNKVRGNRNGLMIHNGFNNTISGNMFSESRQAHVQMAEGIASSVRNNVVTANQYTSVNGEETYRLSSSFGTTAVSQFGSYGGNTYANSSTVFANFNGEPIGFEQWRARTGDNSVLSIP